MQDDILTKAVKNLITHSKSKSKIESLRKKHSKKLHFIPIKYRIFGGILQSMNI
ncbi:hypothetical protein [Campylobacter blaseri]|uniref:hypothetical protein n=1 Tax=Campylobacter blaseri TaxID=2042961 RepID=UPI001F4D5B97|nr:hypothetical protein [Campylobacter blaseri]